MFLNGGEVVVQVLYGIALKPIESACKADRKGGRVLTVSSTAFARMAVYTRRAGKWTDEDGCGCGTNC